MLFLRVKTNRVVRKFEFAIIMPIFCVFCLLCCYLNGYCTNGAPTTNNVTFPKSNNYSTNSGHDNADETYVAQKSASFETQPNDFSRNQSLTFRNWWNNVIDHYDKRIRPSFGIEPLEVKLGFTLLAISSISEATMDWTLEMYFHEYWKDERLKFDASLFNNRTPLTLPQEAMDLLWTPDTSFINALSCQVPQQGSVSHLQLLRVNEHGEMFSAKRLSVTAGCTMKLTMYPFDIQTCYLDISSFGYTTDDIYYDWKSKPLHIDLQNIKLPDFEAISSNSTVENQKYVAGYYSVPRICIVFSRQSGFCFLQLFIPATAVVGASWISLWLENETQFADIVSIILAIIFLSYSYNTVMPKVSYIKAMDIYLGACFIFAFLSLVKLAIMKYMRKKVTKRRGISSALNLFTSDLALNIENSVESLSQIERRRSVIVGQHLANNNLSFVPGKRIRRPSDHDRYWKVMKVFHVGSQLVLPLAFGGFSVFYFFIYPYINVDRSNRCFGR